ncbi:hypothetical protein H4582DRAFT_1946065 [Lactarius indigo]|nr:hypothetical protein H4582DRAFT_1946065 [Lactarius indigo]
MLEGPRLSLWALPTLSITQAKAPVNNVTSGRFIHPSHLGSVSHSCRYDPRIPSLIFHITSAATVHSLCHLRLTESAPSDVDAGRKTSPRS